MRFSINKSELQSAIAVVMKGTSARSTLPVLAGIYLGASGDALKMQSTNLDLSIEYRLPALVEEEGATVFPGKRLSEIVKNLPDAAVHFASEEGECVISCDTATFRIKTLPTEDFPAFPEITPDQEIHVPYPQFSTMVKRVARVTSKDESRPVLTGVLVTLEGTELKMVATDSYRLAVAEASVPDTDAAGFEAVIGGPFMLDLAGLPKSEEDVALGLAENQIVVRYQGTTFINRRIQGNYPNYRQLLPDSFLTRAVMDTSTLMAAVKRMSLLGQANAPVRFDVDPAVDLVQLSSIAQDVGSAQESVPSTTEGEPVQIAFNHSYVLDGLSAMPSDSVALELRGGKSPGIFRASGGERFLYLVMPVRLA